MNQKSLIGAALVVGGIAALYFGYQTQQSLSSQFSEVWDGTPSNKALGLLIGGGIATVVGLGMLGLGFKKPK